MITFFVTTVNYATEYLLSKPLHAAGMSADNVRG